MSPSFERRLHSLKGRLYKSAVRRVLRRFGAGRILALPGLLRRLCCLVRWRVSRPGRIAIAIGGVRVSFPIADAREMCHVESLGGERRLLQRWIQELHPGDVAYDVGANIGLWSVLMAKVVGDKGLVVSFEPETRALCQLRRNLDINGLGNVRPFGVALGNQEGAVELFVDDRVESGVHNLVRSSDGTWIQSAEMVVGDQFIAKSALPVPNVIKIDVEGAEYQVMLGLASALCRPECRAVCCEVHFGILDSTDQNDMPTKIERLLDEAGFRTKQWVDHSHLLAYKRSR